jgi:ubiquinone/menaquinone biosynthesis C-methylase UbiE
MKLSETKNYEPFYKSIYDQALASLKAGKPIENIYDNRGVNISRQLNLIIGERSYGKVLDLGCGLGQVAVSLSFQSKMVIAADISKEALKIVSKIAKIKSLNNIHSVLLSATNLPFKENVFDLIICSGVLEWVPLSDNSQQPERLQINTLIEVKRVLDRLGLFWLGIENRFCYYYLLGAIDHHSELRFVTFLPRFIANYYSKLIRKQQYRNYLYSYWELKKILHKLGFIIYKFLTASPFYSNPRVIADLSKPSEIINFFSHTKYSYVDKVILKAISKLRVAKLLISNFIILCIKL